MNEPLDPLSTHTHFFRSVEEIEAAVDVLAARAAEGLAPRAWSAGCSTGAEPYTLAILCAERGIAASVHATDINPSALAAASAGRFTELAVRRVPARVLERYFERDGDDFVVTSVLRERVTFGLGDLRIDPPPLLSQPGSAPGHDVVLCRNVLIYYDEITAAGIADRLCSALRPGGLLIVGSTDPLAFRASASLRNAGRPGIASYHRADSTSASSPSSTRTFDFAPSSARAFDLALSPFPARTFEPPLAPAPSVADRPTPSRFDLGAALRTAAAHLAAHAWSEAEASLAEAEREAPLAAEPPLYLGVLHRKQGRFEEAAAHLRRAAFLSPDSWIAAYLLAGIWERLGDRARADMELARTLDLLEEDSSAATGLDAIIALDPIETARACRERLRRSR